MILSILMVSGMVGNVVAEKNKYNCYILTADRLFDGYTLYPNEQQPNTHAILILDGKVVKIDASRALKEQTPGGYPINIFGGISGLDQIGYAVTSEPEAENLIQELVDGGATVIKIALEPGGEAGAPWMLPHDSDPVPTTPWPILSQEIVNAIVMKAHSLDKRVIAHVGEETGF